MAFFTNWDEPAEGTVALYSYLSARFTEWDLLLLLKVRDSSPGLGPGELCLDSGSRGGSPDRVLRKEVSPKASPPRPTCMVWRKSPNGALIISTVRSARDLRFDWLELFTSCLRIGMTVVSSTQSTDRNRTSVIRVPSKFLWQSNEILCKKVYFKLFNVWSHSDPVAPVSSLEWICKEEEQ